MEFIMENPDLEAITASAQDYVGPNFVIRQDYELKGIQYSGQNYDFHQLKTGLITIGRKLGAEIITDLRYESLVYGIAYGIAYGTALIPIKNTKTSE